MVSIAKWRQDEYPATDEVQCITIYIPAGDEFKAVAAALLAQAARVENYVEPDSAQAEGLAAVWDDAYSQIDWNGCVTHSEAGTQARVSFWHRWDEILFGAALSIVVDTAVIWNYYAAQTTPAQGDARYQIAYLPAGDYQVRVLYQRLSNAGNLTLYLQDIDNNTVATPINAADMHGTTLRNQVLTGTFTLTDPGFYYFIWSIPSKHAASTGFSSALTMTEVWKESD